MCSQSFYIILLISAYKCKIFRGVNNNDNHVEYTIKNENREIPGIASNVNGASFYDLYNTSYKTASTLEPGSVPQKSCLKLLLLILTAVCGCLSILWTLLIASFMEVGDPVLALLILIIPGYLITGLFFLLYKHKPNKC